MEVQVVKVIECPQGFTFDLLPASDGTVHRIVWSV